MMGQLTRTRPEWTPPNGAGALGAAVSELQRDWAHLQQVLQGYESDD